MLAVREKGSPICVGLDPVYERLPTSLRTVVKPGATEAVAAMRIFCMGVMEAVADHVPCVKIQSACFERYLWPGVQALHKLIADGRKMGLLVILDGKRGDIGISSEHYAAGCLADLSFSDLGDLFGPDALTVNSYLGADGIEPFLKVAVAGGKGLFALVRTSNPGGDAIQGLPLADGGTVAQAVAGVVAKAGSTGACVGQSGYSLLGAVVGATKAEDAAALRQIMPQQIFLVPGFGAQGGSAADVKACFKSDGTGAIITASRSILYAYEKTANNDWMGAIEQAAVKMKKEIAGILL